MESGFVSNLRYNRAVLSKMTDNSKGLILVDPPVQNTFLEDTLSHDGNQKEAQIGKCQIKPFRKGYTDFLSPTPGNRSGSRKSMLEDLEHYLTTEWPPNLNLEAPDLHTMCWYPLKIAAAEWMNFIDAMEYSVEGCEYSTESRFVTDTASLESSLRSLLSWRRRSRDMAAVVRSTAEFIRLPSPNKSSAWVAMASDYDHIARELDRLGSRFEALSPARRIVDRGCGGTTHAESDLFNFGIYAPIFAVHVCVKFV